MKIPSVIYVDTESLLEKKCDNDPEKPSITKISKYTTCGCSIYTHCSLTKANMIFTEVKIL